MFLLKRFFMFRERILIWLFITASVVVDIALFAAAISSREPSRLNALLAGLAYGQVGALAIWTVTGRMHRLARGACLIVATVPLTLLSIGSETRFFQQNLTLNATYAVIVMAAVAIVAVVRRVAKSKWQQQETLQAPLIELFGWTIVVAIASFGARFMDFQIVERGLRKFPVTLTLLAIPLIAEILYRPMFRPRHLWKWLVFVAAAYAMGCYLVERRFAPLVFATQAIYLAAWMVVRSLESDRQDVAEPGENDVPEDEPVSETSNSGK